MLIKSMVDRMFGLGLFKRPPTATNPEQERGLETQFNSELLPDRNLQVTYVVPIRLANEKNKFI